MPALIVTRWSGFGRYASASVRSAVFADTNQWLPTAHPPLGPGTRTDTLSRLPEKTAQLASPTRDRWTDLYGCMSRSNRSSVARM